MVSADEVSRSVRGAAALMNRRPDALSLFDTTFEAFWRSFGAILLTGPAYVVDLALVWQRLGLAGAGRPLFDDPGLALLVAAGHVAAFLALPIAMIFVARRFRLGARYVPFVVVTNWLAVFTSLALALPAALYLLGLEPRPAAAMVTAAFGLVALVIRWHATRATLGVGRGAAMLVTLLGLGPSLATGALLDAAL